jgi:hypothetical protein
MSLLARVLRSSGPTHGTHGTKPRQWPLSTWQTSFNPNQPDLPALAKWSSALSDME